MVLSNAQSVVVNIIRNSCYRASISRIRRAAFPRLYPAILVQPNGSTINIKYSEPIGVVQLPFDINTLSEAEKRRRLTKRQLTSRTDTKKVVEKEQQDTSKDIKFDPRKYINMKN
jgi:large subunit ribosomal protein L55